MSDILAETVAERAEAYHRLNKQLVKEFTKTDWKEQKSILDDQWWQDVKPWFTTQHLEILGRPVTAIGGYAWWIEE